MTRFLILCACALSLGWTAPAPAQAQAPTALERAEQALVEAWQQEPLTLRNAVFVSAEPTGFGVYEPRGSNRFAPGEAVVVYFEPVGYAWEENADGTFTIGVVLDLFIRDPEGTILLGREALDRQVFVTRNRARELFLFPVLNLTGAPEGEYVLEYRLRDLNSDKVGSVSMPFVIAAD